jgi:hypothetical protein
VSPGGVLFIELVVDSIYQPWNKRCQISSRSVNGLDIGFSQADESAYIPEPGLQVRFQKLLVNVLHALNLYKQAATGRRETQEMIVTAFEQSGFTNLVYYDICTFLSDNRERLSSGFRDFKKF